MAHTLRVHMPNGTWVIVSIVQLWGKYMTIGYLDPYPEALRTDNIRLLGPKTILYKAIERF